MVIIFIIGGILNRLRGGGFSKKEIPFVKTIYDISYASIFSFIISRVGYIGSDLFYVLTILFLSMRLGRSFGWGGYINAIIFGEIDKDRSDVKIIDYFFKKSKNPTIGGTVALSVRGFIWSSCLYLGFLVINKLTLLGNNFYYIPLIGLAMGPIYLISSLVYKVLTDKKGGWPLAEIIFGGYLWAMIYILIG